MNSTEFEVYSRITIRVNGSNENFDSSEEFNNWWALLALVLVAGTAAGNILVCLAITWERRLQNVTNYFLMSLAITDLMVAILVMPLGIVTLFRGYFPLPSVYCLAWICLDVLFCTASIMHLCTISVDRYLSLRYPMKFGRNKSRRRVTLKIVFVWLLSIAMSLPLSLMYSKDHDSVLIDGDCQIPDPLYKCIGSIICFYIPLIVMLVTYALTVRLLAEQRQNLGTPDWSSGWMGGPTTTALERRCTWRKLLNATRGGRPATPQHAHSAASTDTELTTIDTHELWIQETEPAPCTMSALGQFGAEMLKLSRGLEAASQSNSPVRNDCSESNGPLLNDRQFRQQGSWLKRRRASTFHEGDTRDRDENSPRWRRRNSSFHDLRSGGNNSPEDKDFLGETSNCDNLLLPPPCTCPYFGEKQGDKSPTPRPSEVKIIPEVRKATGLLRKEASPTNTVVTWENESRRSSFGCSKTKIKTDKSFLVEKNFLTERNKTPLLLRRSATMRQNGHTPFIDRNKNPSSPCLLQRYNYNNTNLRATIRSHHSRNSSVISRNSSRHGRIIRLEQKATKVLGVVFFTFVILWAPFFVLNLVPIVCEECEKNINNWVFQFVTWLGYASSLVNPIFYTIFNKVFRQAFKKVLTCKYRNPKWRPHR